MVVCSIRLIAGSYRQSVWCGVSADRLEDPSLLAGDPAMGCLNGYSDCLIRS